MKHARVSLDRLLGHLGQTVTFESDGLTAPALVQAVRSPAAAEVPSAALDRTAILCLPRPPVSGEAVALDGVRHRVGALQPVHLGPDEPVAWRLMLLAQG